MKKIAVSPLSIKRKLRKQPESVPERGEAFSVFARDVLNCKIEYRKTRQAFIARGIASSAQSKKNNAYILADKVINTLQRKLDQAKKRAANGKKNFPL